MLLRPQTKCLFAGFITVLICLMAAGPASAQKLKKSTNLICCRLEDGRTSMAPADMCTQTGGRQTFLRHCRPPLCCRRGPRNTSFVFPPALCEQNDGRALEPEVCFRRTVCCRTEPDQDGESYYYFERYVDKCQRRNDEVVHHEHCQVCCQVEKPDGTQVHGFIDLAGCKSAGGSQADKARYCLP